MSFLIGAIGGGMIQRKSLQKYLQTSEYSLALYNTSFIEQAQDMHELKMEK